MQGYGAHVVGTWSISTEPYLDVPLNGLSHIDRPGVHWLLSIGCSMTMTMMCGGMGHAGAFLRKGSYNFPPPVWEEWEIPLFPPPTFPTFPNIHFPTFGAAIITEYYISSTCFLMETCPFKERTQP